ncbi:MAG: hypothetical protein Ct9H300mP10_02110 [Methanobacteriota archaeon]|nr:MAG: hypothetical protein Ct9H300mP10_02110 [Euryarchaeota archaeon]
MDTVPRATWQTPWPRPAGLVYPSQHERRGQASEVYRVKRFESGLVLDPVTISPDSTIGELRAIKSSRVLRFPGVDDSGVPVGIITNRDIRFVSDDSVKVSL